MVKSDFDQEQGASPAAAALQDDRGVSAFRPIRVRKAADEVVAVLANAISGGLYPIGALLPRERDLAARLGVSRTVVHEAIGVLRRAGVVTVRRGPSGGAMVTSPDRLAGVIAELSDETALSLPLLLQVRRTLEITSALLVAESADDDALARLHALVEPLDGLMDDPAGFLEQDIRFHRELAALTRNPALNQSVSWVLERLAEAVSQFPVGRVDLDHALLNQRHTLQAIEERDKSRIITAMDEHLASFEELFLGRKLSTVVTPEETLLP